MADIHDQAMAWAQANQADPRAQDIMAKAWASKNPDDPRAHSILAKFAPPQGSVTTQAGAFGRISAPTNLPPDAADKVQQKAINSLPVAGGILGSAVGPEGTGLGAMLGGTAAAALGAATGSAAKNLVNKDPSSAPQALKQIGLDALFKGALPELGGRVIGKVGEGATKAGDYLMQKAVGMRKYVPGVGEELANEGVIGTKNMMAGQVENALESRGQEIGNLASGLSEVSTDAPAQAVLTRAQRLVMPDGTIRPENIEEYSQLKSLADRITESGGAEGSVTGELAAAQRAASGKLAKKAGAYRLTNPSEGMKAGMYGSEQGGWSQALKDAYSAANPEAPGALAEADKAYGALAQADRSLSVPESIPHSFGGLLHKTIPGTPLVASLVGRGAIKGGGALTSVGDVAPNTVRALQTLLSGNSGGQ